MKRAEAQVIGAPFLQFHKTANHFNNIGAVENLLYGILADHGRANYDFKKIVADLLRMNICFYRVVTGVRTS